MSIEHWIYSPDAPLDRAFAAQACAAIGDIGWAIACVRNVDDPVVEEHGPLATGEVIGWVPGGQAEPEILAALRDGDGKAVQDLWARELLAIVSLRVATRGSAEWDDEAMREQAKGMPAKHRAEAQQAVTFYSIESGAGRNEPTLEFQTLFWRALGVLSNGLMEDPQEGELISTIQQIGRDGEHADEALNAMDADREAMLTRRSTVPLEVPASGPRQDRGAMAVDAAALVLGGMEVADLLLRATSLPSFRSMPGLAGSLLAILMAWYFARARDRFGYWMLVALAALMLATSVPSLLGASGLEAMLVASRAMAGVMAIGLLLGPARRQGTDEAGAARRG